MQRREQNFIAIELLTKCPLKEYLSTFPKECPVKAYWNKDIVSRVKYIESLSNLEIALLLRAHNGCEKKMLDAIGHRSVNH